MKEIKELIAAVNRVIEKKPSSLSKKKETLLQLNSTVLQLEQLLNKINKIKLVSSTEYNNEINLLNYELKSLGGSTLPLIAISQLSKKQNIPVLPGYVIECIVVSSFDNVLSDGNMYFVRSCDHFAIKINNKIFNGTIGNNNFLKNISSCHKILDCKYGVNCQRIEICDYYHDPKIVANCKDRRNFANWQGMIASRDNITNDLHDILQMGNIGVFANKPIHDILIYLLLCGMQKNN